MIKRTSTKAFFALLLPISLLMSSNPAIALDETPAQSDAASKAGKIVLHSLKIFVGSILMCSAGKSAKAIYDFPTDDQNAKVTGGIKGLCKHMFWTGIKASHPWNEASAIYKFWAPGLGGAALTACGINGILTEAGVIDNNTACAA